MSTINESLKQLEVQRNRAQKELAGLEAAINALRPLVAVTMSVPAKTVAPVAAQPAKPAVAAPAKKHTISAAGKASIRAATKARWAKIRAEKRLASLKAFVSAPVKTAVPVAAPAKKGTLSAAGKANIRAVQKARWAKYRAEKAKAKK